jgi:hypothetical protein
MPVLGYAKARRGLSPVDTLTPEAAVWISPFGMLDNFLTKLHQVTNNAAQSTPPMGLRPISIPPPAITALNALPVATANHQIHPQTTPETVPIRPERKESSYRPIRLRRS